jgi:biopolymer transport protein ExbB/biopolymer transport protein TolQ
MMLLLTLFEALAEEEAASGFTLTEIWQHSGGLARAVIVTLILMMVGAIVIAIERWIAFRAATNQSMALAAAIVPHLQKKDVSAALRMTRDDDYKWSYLGALLRAGLAELDLRLDAHGVSNGHRAVDKAIGQELAKLRRGMAVLATVGSTAPFVGLFGTTFGVINAFQGMATAGSGLAAISAGISEALITTGVGIGVAVVGVWLFNYYNHRIEKVTEELTSSEADFMDWAEKLLQEQLTDEAAK